MGIIFNLIIFLVFIIFAIIIWQNIFYKAGFPKWYGYLMIVPILNLIMLIYLAFVEWPTDTERKVDIIKEDVVRSQNKNQSFPSDFK